MEYDSFDFIASYGVYDDPVKGWHVPLPFNGQQVNYISSEILKLVKRENPAETTWMIMRLLRTVVRYQREIAQLDSMFDGLVRQEVIHNLTRVRGTSYKLGSRHGFVYSCPNCGADLTNRLDSMSSSHVMPVASKPSTVRYPKVRA